MIAELREAFEEEEGEIETMYDILVDGLVSYESLLLCALGSARMVEMSKTKKTSRRNFETLAMNLKMCMSEAFPVCDVFDHPTQRRRMNKRFTGFGFCGIKRKPRTAR